MALDATTGNVMLNEVKHLAEVQRKFRRSTMRCFTPFNMTMGDIAIKVILSEEKYLNKHRISNGEDTCPYMQH